MVKTIGIRPVTTLANGRVDPTTIIAPAQRDLVIRVRNNTFGSYILIAYEVGALASFTGSLQDTYKVPAGAVDIFIVAKGQCLYAATPGEINGELSAHYYEAFPTVDD